MPKFVGPEYMPVHDESRLSKQIYRIRYVMLDGCWRSLQEVARLSNSPSTSVASQLRNLRMPENGGYVVDRRARGDRNTGLFEYRLSIAVVDRAHLIEQVRRRTEILTEAEARYVKAKHELAEAEAAVVEYEGSPVQAPLPL